MSHGRYTERPLPNYSASSNYLPSKLHIRYRLPRASVPQWHLGAPQAQWIYRAGPRASAPISHGRYTEHPFPNYSASSNYLPSKRHSRYRLLRTSFPLWIPGASQAQWNYRAGPGASISFCRVYVRRFALAARGSGGLLNYKITNITKRYSSTPP